MAEPLTKQDLIEVLDERFGKYDQKLDERFAEQRSWVQAELASQFVNERKYYAQLVRDELTQLRHQLARIENAVGGDAKDALMEIDGVKQRMSELEADVAKLLTA